MIKMLVSGKRNGIRMMDNVGYFTDGEISSPLPIILMEFHFN